jgi:putative NADPH-quinone reductase
MQQKHILVIAGHPDPDGNRFQHALMHAYAEGARQGGHAVRTLNLGELDFPLLSTASEFQQGTPPDVIAAAQESIRWADHLVIGFPLWLGGAPAKLKAFFEQTFRPGFAFDAARGARLPRKRLAGKTARLVVTMGMPAMFFRLAFRSHGTKSIERNILAFCGVRPVRTTLIGSVEKLNGAERAAWLGKLVRFGRRAT